MTWRQRGLVDRLGLDGYYLFHSVRADLLGRSSEAIAAYDAAIVRTGDEVEREFMRRRQDSLSLAVDPGVIFVDPLPNIVEIDRRYRS